ncbi:MAG: hypothetical protein LBB55_05680, partial [Zoogloeaceae bacterium]|nr:hypothetical protein [Zoogloeaceae bacterium]
MASPAAFAAETQATQPQPGSLGVIAAFGVFFFTLLTAKWAAEKSREDAECHPELRTINGFQNGLAITGCYLSIAALLGIPALAAAHGQAAMVAILGFFAGWPLLSLLAERLHNIGGYTFADLIAWRFPDNRVRIFAALAVFAIAIPYLAVQLLGAGQLLRLLFGFEYWLAIVIAGALLLAYCNMSGLSAATWLQIVKAILLLCGMFLFVVLVLWKLGVQADLFHARVLELKAMLQTDASPANASPAFPILDDPLSLFSLGLTLCLGNLGLPHTLARFSQVPDAREARKSSLWASLWVGFFCLAMGIVVSGMEAVNQKTRFFDLALVRQDGGNMVILYFARLLGNEIFMGALVAIALVSLAAVAVGMARAAAAALSNDLYALVLCRGKASAGKEKKLFDLALALLFVVATLLALTLTRCNLALALAFVLAIAASSTAPVLLLTLFWKDCTSRGLVCGGIAGLLSALVAGFFSPMLWVDLLNRESPLFPYAFPTLFSASAAFLVAGIVSLADRGKNAQKERAAW